MLNPDLDCLVGFIQSSIDENTGSLFIPYFQRGILHNLGCYSKCKFKLKDYEIHLYIFQIRGLKCFIFSSQICKCLVGKKNNMVLMTLFILLAFDLHINLDSFRYAFIPLVTRSHWKVLVQIALSFTSPTLILECFLISQIVFFLTNRSF